MPVFDFNDETKEEKKAPECTYTVIRSNETTASPEHPILFWTTVIENGSTIPGVYLQIPSVKLLLNFR